MNIQENQCEICGLFLLKKNLKRHHKKHQDQNEKDEIKCDFCEKTFSRRFNMKRHIENNHTQVTIEI